MHSHKYGQASPKEVTQLQLPFASMALLVACAICTLLYAYTGGSELFVCFPREPFQLYGAPAFLSLLTHANFPHLFLNCLFLFMAGAKVEARLGSAKLFQLYLLCGLAGIAGQAYLSPVATIGASGAVSGLVAFLAVSRPKELTTQSVPLGLWVALWFALDFFALAGSWQQLQAGGIGHGAHLGGAFAGAVLGLLPFFQDEKQSFSAGPKSRHLIPHANRAGSPCRH